MATNGRRLVVIAGAAPVPDETFIARDLDALRTCGWEMVCFGLAERFLSAPPPPGAPANAALGLACLRRCLRLWRRPRQVLALFRSRRLVRRVAAAARGTDLVLAQFAWLTADIAAVAAEAAGVPWVCAVHAWDVFAQPPRLVRTRLAGASRIIACSEAARRAVVAAGVPADQIVLIHHGLPLDDFPCRTRQPEEGGELLAVGRLESKKGFDVLLRALVRLPAAVSFRLSLIGEGRRRAELEALTSALGIESRVCFLGHLSADEVRRRLQAAALLVLPSRRLADGDRDGIANVLVEAMALGVPVVTTTAGAAGEIIRDGINGVLVPPDDEASLAAALTAIMEDRPLRERLARAARHTVEAHFDASRTGAELSAALASLVPQEASEPQGWRQKETTT